MSDVEFDCDIDLKENVVNSRAKGDVVRVKHKGKGEYFEDPEDDGKERSFFAMNISRILLKTLTEMGISVPTKIQQRAIPYALMGRDIVACALTGSGKTLAFLLPIMERLLYREKVPKTRVLVLVPTRELAAQCHSVAVTLGTRIGVEVGLAVGGHSVREQEASIRKRPDLLIATPGRLVDFMHNLVSFSLADIEILVLDEADKMLDDGFANELNDIISGTPKSRQTMLFSATMTDNVEKLVRLSLDKPIRLFVDAPTATVAKLVQEFVRIRPQNEPDRIVFVAALVTRIYTGGCIVFFKQRKTVHEAFLLLNEINLPVAELHGDMTQPERTKSLELFHSTLRGNSVGARILLATNVAARGLDISGIEAVINCDMPDSYDQYLHRVGRTARAGRAGTSITLVGEGDRILLKEIVRHSADDIRQRQIEANALESISAQITQARSIVEQKLKTEKTEDEFKRMEKQLKTAENLVEHAEEIMSRPKRVYIAKNKPRPRGGTSKRKSFNK